MRGERRGNPCPEQSASALSRLLFLWNDALLATGHERPLQPDDVWDVREDMSTVASREAFAATGVLDSPQAGYLLRGFYLANRRDIWRSGLYRLGQELAQLIQPVLLHRILVYLEDEQSPVWHGLAYCCALFAAACLKTLLENHYFITCVRCGLRGRAVCVDLVYQKALRLNSCAVDAQSTGKIVNHMQADAQKFYDSCWGFHLVWAALLQVIGCVVLLFLVLGPAMVCGLALIVGLIPLNGALIRAQHQARRETSSKTDTRVNAINEVLLAIRAVKLNAWERHFESSIAESRQRELNLIYSLGINKALLSTLANITPSLVTLASLAWYSGVQRFELDAPTIFTSIALFENMKDPLGQVAGRVSSFVDLAVAARRIESFLDSKEAQTPEREIGEVGAGEIKVAGGSFSWHQCERAATLQNTKTSSAQSVRDGQYHPLVEDSPRSAETALSLDDHGLALEGAHTSEGAFCIKGVELEVPQASLVYVIGTVAAGKSSLLAAILGEMEAAEGTHTCLGGDVAYVTQQPWILNMSLRENVVISGSSSKPVDEQRYQQALWAAGLEADLQALPAGDATEIGERGINLSGGQKQRVALARAVYSRAGICLIDDPTSALDCVMASWVINHVIGPDGILAKEGRTRLVVTNILEPSVLGKADAVVWLDHGYMRYKGLFELLSTRDQDNFALFLAEEKAKGAVLSDRGTAFETESIEIHQGNQERRTCAEDHHGNGKLGNSKAQFLIPQDFSAIQQLQADNMEKGPLLVIDQQHQLLSDRQTGTLVVAEDRQTGMVESHVYRRLCQFAQTFYVACTLLLFVISQLVALGRDCFLAFWTTWNTEGETNLFLAVFAGLTMLFATLTLFRALMLVDLGFRCSTSLHMQSIHAVLNSPLSYFDVTPTGRLVNRFARDTESVDTKVWESWRGFLDLLLPLLGTVLLVCAILPAFMLVVPILACIALRIQSYYRCSSRELKRLASISLSPMYDWFGCTLDGVATIRANGLMHDFVAENAMRSDEANRFQYMQKICDRWLGTRLEMLGNVLCFVAMVLGALSRESSHNALLGLALASSMRLARTVNYTVRQFTLLESEMTSVERLLYICDLPSEQDKLNSPVLHAWQPSDGSLCFNGVSLRYRPLLPMVLNNISFAVSDGKKLGVCGRTGSGKSSLIQALFRLVALETGSVLIGGVDIATISLPVLRAALSICPQDPVIFSGTVAENLDPLGEYNEADLARACRQVGLDRVNINEQVLDSGSNFSAGTRQMLVLARALLRSSKILVLDEATSSISPEVDSQIQKALSVEFAAVTRVVIAHRLQTIMDADEVLVMSDGRIAEIGPPDVLLAAPNSVLAQLAVDMGGRPSSHSAHARDAQR